ncbi:MAG: hypothetical protein RLZ44_706 [Pseudomonadota bacterium]
MFPVLFSLIAAMLFALLALGMYGTEGVIEHSWIDMVFWGLIGAGAGVSLINAFGPCLPCVLSRTLDWRWLARWWCRASRCSH